MKTIRIESSQGMLTPRGRLADTWGSRLKGLLGARELPEDFCLVLTPCGTIHMYFMGIPLDIAYLNAEGIVIGLQWELQPWRIGAAYAGNRHVLEAPVGGVLRSLKAGDRVFWSLDK